MEHNFVGSGQWNCYVVSESDDTCQESDAVFYTHTRQFYGHLSR